MEIVVKVPLVYFHKVLLALNAVFRRFPKYTFEADGITVNGRRTHQAVGKQVLEQMRRVTPLGHHHVIVVARHNAVGTRQAEVRTFIGKAQGSTTAGREVVDTFVSANEEEVVNWVAKMVRKGFSVTVDWDSEARLFRCTAYRKTK